MISAGQIRPARAPEAEAQARSPWGLQPIITFPENVVELRPGMSRQPPVQQPRITTNPNRFTREELWREGVRLGPVVSAPAESDSAALDVDILLPEWLPLALHAEYLKAWGRIVERELVIHMENPLTWLGLAKPRRKYKRFPDRKSLERFFEIHGQPLLERFRMKAQEHFAGVCFVTDRKPHSGLFSEKWPEFLKKGALTPMMIKVESDRTTEDQRGIEAKILIRSILQRMRYCYGGEWDSEMEAATGMAPTLESAKSGNHAFLAALDAVEAALETGVDVYTLKILLEAALADAPPDFKRMCATNDGKQEEPKPKNPVEARPKNGIRRSTVQTKPPRSAQPQRAPIPGRDVAPIQQLVDTCLAEAMGILPPKTREALARIPERASKHLDLRQTGLFLDGVIREVNGKHYPLTTQLQALREAILSIH